jgi:hypothetical protein
MSQPGTWATDMEAQAAAETLGHPLLIWTMNTGRHGFLYNHLDSSESQQTLHIVHSVDHFDALVVNNSSLNLQYTQQLAAQCSSSSIQTFSIQINFNSNMVVTEVVEATCPQEQPQKHPSRANGKRKLPSFMTQKNITAITKPAQDQDSVTPQLANQILHYGHKGINTKRRRLFETALNDGWGVQGDGCSPTVPIKQP